MNIDNKKNKKDIIELNYHQLSYIVSSLFLTAFFIFTSGYYWGKKACSQSVIDQAKVDFQDIKYMEESDSDTEDIDNINNSEDLSGFKDIERESRAQSVASEKAEKYQYAAHLAGFGTESAAQKALNNFSKWGYKLKISQRVGKASNGQERKWYQIVTDWYNDKQALENLLIGIKKAGKLKNVTIVSRKLKTENI